METKTCRHCDGTGMLGEGHVGEFREAPVGTTFACAWCNGSGQHIEWPDGIWEEGERQQGPINYSGNTITTAVERTALAFMRVLDDANMPYVCFRDPNHNNPRYRIVIRTGDEI